MGKRWRKQCEGTQCRDVAFFPPGKAPVPGDPFFKPVAAAEGQAAEEEKKDAVADGLKTVAENLAENESFKKWYEPKLDQLKLTLWDQLSPGEKAALISFLGVNAVAGGLAFASNPQLRQSLSGVNVGKPLGWIPKSPVEGFTYKLPGAGETATGFSADLTLTPYLEMWRNRPGFIPSGATFGLESSYDPKGGFNLTGGKFGLDFLGGALKAEGKTFNSLSPYPMLMQGREGMPPSWLMQQYPGLPDIRTGPGAQFMLSADLLKLSPWLQKHF